MPAPLKGEDMTDAERDQCQQCQKAMSAGLDRLRQELAELRNSMDLQEKEARFLAWQNVELKKQIATLKSGQS
jgi:hypothetical protein